MAEENTSNALTLDKLAGKQIILFDGVCGLCDHFVQLVLDHDSQGIFHFAPLQGDFAVQLLKRHGLAAADLNTVYLVRDYGLGTESLLNRSDAAVTVMGQLDGPPRLLGAGRFVPRPLRDLVYKMVARWRYAIFGKRDACRLPQPQEKARFIDL